MLLTQILLALQLLHYYNAAALPMPHSTHLVKRMEKVSEATQEIGTSRGSLRSGFNSDKSLAVGRTLGGKREGATSLKIWDPEDNFEAREMLKEDGKGKEIAGGSKSAKYFSTAGGNHIVKVKESWPAIVKEPSSHLLGTGVFGINLKTEDITELTKIYDHLYQGSKDHSEAAEKFAQFLKGSPLDQKENVEKNVASSLHDPEISKEKTKANDKYPARQLPQASTSQGEKSYLPEDIGKRGGPPETKTGPGIEQERKFEEMKFNPPVQSQEAYVTREPDYENIRGNTKSLIRGVAELGKLKFKGRLGGAIKKLSAKVEKNLEDTKAKYGRGV
ncbi:hypothetical protein PGT21_030296 [Puccinia graminis f. sp. tritici]|uniref:Uncharacterized protein n=1 Tax=Puccinia graminis f. sp. tritici TaxID=56615 RepID=A0A5B0MID3_PUCGR|nr:hypothetical protein PGTUg99_029409 [Puccinia graminis f. sp. tritici]KAA1091285.1 hypothetical protein PGT21_030296 [Puccinia graminis f. sp. tritici]